MFELGDGTIEGITGFVVAQAAREGDLAALECFALVAEWTGQGMADLAATLDPGAFIIGGGLSAASDLLLEPIKKAFAAHVTGRGHVFSRSPTNPRRNRSSRAAQNGRGFNIRRPRRRQSAAVSTGTSQSRR
jgi:predicted NBD/HSP70 family sugar kinase